MSMYRQTFGLSAPIQLQMERMLVKNVNLFQANKTKISKNGKVGYFHFRLGQDPALESQKIQGYIAQKPEVKHFRFNVRGQQAAPAQTEPVANPPLRRNPNI